MNMDNIFSAAAENGNLKLVRVCLAAGADIHAWDNCALCWACAKGHLPVVKHLVEAGADISADDYDAIFWAVYNGHVEVVAYLESRM